MLTSYQFWKKQQSFEKTEWYSSPFKDYSLLDFEQVIDIIQQSIQQKIDKKMEEAIYTNNQYIAFSFDLMDLYPMSFLDKRKIRRQNGLYWFYQKVIHPLLIQAEEQGFHTEIYRITMRQVSFCLYIPSICQEQWRLSDEENLQQQAIETLAIQYSKRYSPLLSAMKAMYSFQKQDELIEQWRESE